MKSQVECSFTKNGTVLSSLKSRYTRTSMFSPGYLALVVGSGLCIMIPAAYFELPTWAVACLLLVWAMVMVGRRKQSFVIEEMER